MLRILSPVNALKNVLRGGRKRMTKLAKVNLKSQLTVRVWLSNSAQVIVHTRWGVPLFIIVGLCVPEAPCVRKHANLSMREMLVFVILSSRIVRVISLKVEWRVFAHVTSACIVLLPLKKVFCIKRSETPGRLVYSSSMAAVTSRHTLYTNIASIAKNIQIQPRPFVFQIPGKIGLRKQKHISFC